MPPGYRLAGAGLRRMGAVMSSVVTPKRQRLHGLDLARWLAFVGMVVVNFTIVMGAPEGGLARLLEGRAAALFVVLAGVGLGLAERPGAWWGTQRRALFLLVVGLLNMLIFPADILHYYAVYFALGAALVARNTRGLILGMGGLILLAPALLLLIPFDAGWDWTTLDYRGFWTPAGFVRNLFYNGFHPVVPWLAFLIWGLVLARLPLDAARVQGRLIAGGLALWLSAEAVSAVLLRLDPELAEVAGTGPIPALPLYMMAALGAATACLGACLWAAPRVPRIVAWVTPAGRQTLTLYIAHIVIGMGVLEALGWLGEQSRALALGASALFCVLATVYAALWARHFRRGPVEALMRALAG